MFKTIVLGSLVGFISLIAINVATFKPEPRKVITRVEVKDSDLALLGRVVDGESGICDINGKMNVVAFILNDMELHDKTLEETIMYKPRAWRYSTMGVVHWKPSNHFRDSLKVSLDGLMDEPVIYIRRDILSEATNYLTNEMYEAVKHRLGKHTIVEQDSCHTFYFKGE